MNKIKKLSMLALLISIFTTKLFSQDLIITTDGDTINCKISKIKRDYIYFTCGNKNEFRKTLLPLNQVGNYQYNYFEEAEVPVDKTVKKNNFSHWRIGADFGWGYRIGKTPSSVSSEDKQYIKGLKSGYNYGGELAYYFTEPIGVGVKYLAFRVKNSEDCYIPSATGYSNIYTSDDITITFIGPYFSTRFLNHNKKNALFFNAAMGYLGYYDKAILDNNRYIISGYTIGSGIDIGYDIGISKNFAIGFKISSVMGKLTKCYCNNGLYKVKVELDEDSYESLCRLDISVGIRFNSGK